MTSFTRISLNFRGDRTKIKFFVILCILALGLQQALAQDEIYGRPSYAFACVVSRWGNYASLADEGRGELYQAAYSAVFGGVLVRGWMHQHFVWKGDSGQKTARYDFALCAEVAVGTEYSSVDIQVRGFLRDVSSHSYPIKTTLYRYRKSTLGYWVFIDGDVVNKPVDMVKGHKYTIGYVVDVFAKCYPRSYAPMAHANLGEQGCSFWWQPTGVFDG